MYKYIFFIVLCLFIVGCGKRAIQIDADGESQDNFEIPLMPTEVPPFPGETSEESGSESRSDEVGFPFLPEPPPIPLPNIPRVPACKILLEKCRARPDLAGRIVDAPNPQSVREQQFCLHGQLTELNGLCKNDSSSELQSFYGVIQAQNFVPLVSRSIHSTLCRINLPHGCRRHPSFNGAFLDDYEDSRLSPDRCVKRAKEYTLWCDNHVGRMAKAEFIGESGGVTHSTSYKAHGCFISLRCYNQGNKLLESWQHDGANANAQSCRARLQKVAKGCENPQQQVSYATYQDAFGNQTSLSYTSVGVKIPIYRFHHAKPGYLDHQFSHSSKPHAPEFKLDGLAFYLYKVGNGTCNVPVVSCWGVNNHPGVGFGHTATTTYKCPAGYSLQGKLGYLCSSGGSTPLYSVGSWAAGGDQLITDYNHSRDLLRNGYGDYIGSGQYIGSAP